MRFFVHTWRESARQQPLTAHLTPDSWNDYSFLTLHYLVVVDAWGQAHQIGQVKIGEFGQQQLVITQLPDRFEALPERFFSLGQSDSFYGNLQALGSELNEVVLTALRDIAYSQENYERAIDERVTQRSLLRDVSPMTVEGQFRRLARGGDRLSRYQFAYQSPSGGQALGVAPPPVTLSFEVLPESNPPTNIHVLIGRNGVGKTHLLQGMTQALVGQVAEGAGNFLNQEARLVKRPLFANVVSVTFSAFDPFEPLPEGDVEAAGIRYAYVGLKQPPLPDGSVAGLKSYQDLQREFASSLWSCHRQRRLDRLRRAVTVLATDPVFRDNGIYELLVQTSAEAGGTATTAGQLTGSDAAQWFGRLSSGHKIVLLTIVRLVETVEERTLVLLDEPEAHLHPPLLAAFVRALSDLLVERNGVALIATHSPVVLQEVPRHCVWKLRRHGATLLAERPELETFGENVGVLTREAFGLEVTESGFHQLLREAVRQRGDYAAVVELFAGQLGMEARALVRALTLTQSPR